MHSTCCYIQTAGKWDEGKILACCWFFSWYQRQSGQHVACGTFECKISIAEVGHQFEYWWWQPAHGFCTVAFGKVKFWSWHLPSNCYGNACQGFRRHHIQLIRRTYENGSVAWPLFQLSWVKQSGRTAWHVTLENKCDISLDKSTSRHAPDKSAIVLLDLLWTMSSDCVCESGYGCQKHRF